MITPQNINIMTFDSNRLYVNSAYVELLRHNKIDTAQRLWDLNSTSVKNVLKTRGTSKAYLSDPLSGKKIEVYIKRYLKPSLKDRFKCAISLKSSFQDGALHEWRAICRFHELGLKTMTPLAAATISDRTCNLTLGITDYIRASDFFSCQDCTDISRRNKIIKSIAAFAGIMHSNGLAHQDFYLVHIFIRTQENDTVYLIDLQRTIMQNRLSKRWRVKDLAQITFATEPFFSAEEIALFRDTYISYNDQAQSGEDSVDALWRSVERKAQRIKQHTHKHDL
jgi:tRNA A-37 threonylcarbamoyl transferase component Bud32